MTKLNTKYKKRRERIRKYMHNAGAWVLSPAVIKELSKDYEVTERQIYLDMKAVIRTFPKPKIEEVAQKFLISFEKAIDKSIELMRSTLDETAERGVKLYFQAVENYTKFLESYRRKEKVPEKYEIKSPTKLILEIIDGNPKDEDGSSDEGSSKKN